MTREPTDAQVQFAFADAAPSHVDSYLGGAVAVAYVDRFVAPPGFGAAVLRLTSTPVDVDPSEVVAYALVSFEPRDCAVVLSVHTTPRMRRRGVATRLYDAIERHYGVTLRPSVAQTKEGARLWRSRSRSRGDAR